jgi:hypothetical protein
MLVGAVAAGVALLGGSGAAAPSASQARDASYLLHAEFGVDYEVEWTQESGDQVTDCNTWSIDRGTNEVVVGSTEMPGRLEPMPGRIVVFRRYSRSPRYGGWADGVAVGAAKGTVHRTLVQRAGANQCGDTPPRSLPVPTNDCRGGRGVEYTTRSATIRAEMRRGFFALDEATRTESPSTHGERNPLVRALAVTAVGRLPYQKCETSKYAPELPANIGVVVRPVDFTALRSLKPGERHRIVRQWSGHCRDDLPDNAACRFTLDVHVDIRRWKPGTPYP